MTSKMPIRPSMFAAIVIGIAWSWAAGTKWVWIPRRVSNQRLATMAPKVRASAPVPMPITTPHNSQSCHVWVMNSEAAAARPLVPSEATTVRRRPQCSITAAATGADRP